MDTVFDIFGSAEIASSSVEPPFDIFGVAGGSDIMDESVIETVNSHGAVKKDPHMQRLISDTINECSLIAPTIHTDVCSSNATLAIVGKRLGLTGDVYQILSQAKAATNCGTEKCVINKVIPTTKTLAMFKIDGPTDNKLLTNINIDTILKQWEIRFADFMAYNFNMVDYYDYSFDNGHIINKPDTLATRTMDSNYRSGFRTMGCVINSDSYFGAGKHWMALFVDMRVVPATIEFFNSSGNAPTPSWVSWMEKTRSQLKTIGIAAEIIRVTNRKQQKSRTECGVYSLFYIWSRLNGLPYEYYRTHVVQDQLMFEFRQHLFGGAQPKFSWEEYSKKVKLMWED